MTGIYDEEWNLECEPPTTYPLDLLKVSGHAIEVDDVRNWRNEFDADLNKNSIEKTVNEIVGDILGNVRTPTPPLPDLENPHV